MNKIEEYKKKINYDVWADVTHRVSDKVWDYDKIDAQRNEEWNGIHKLVTDHAVEKRVTAEEIAKRNAIFYNHREINKP